MTRFVLCRAGGLELGVEGDPILDAADLPSVGEAVTILRGLEAMREAVVRSGEERRAAALEEGLADARALAESEAREAIARIAERFDEALRVERDERRRQEVDLAIAIVSRIAGELGEAQVVSALARVAIAEIDTVKPLRVRVHISLESAIRLALCGPATDSPHPQIEIVGDDSIKRLDCEIEHGNALVAAGLDVQLRAIRDAFARIGEPGA